MNEQPHISNGSISVIQVLSGSRGRGRAELIDYHGQKAVRKIYPDNLAQHAHREYDIMHQFGGVRTEIPTVLEHGHNYVIYPYYEDNELNIYRQPDGLLPRSLMPLDVAKQAFDALRFLHDQGYAIIDFHPGNVLHGPKCGVKLIDFEYAYKYPGEIPPFEKCPAIAGTPEDFDGDLPLSWPIGRNPYIVKCKPYTGLTLKSLLNDPTWLQHLKRTIFQTKRLGVVYAKILLNLVLAKKWYGSLQSYFRHRKKSNIPKK